MRYDDRRSSADEQFGPMRQVTSQAPLNPNAIRRDDPASRAAVILPVLPTLPANAQVFNSGQDTDIKNGVGGVTDASLGTYEVFTFTAPQGYVLYVDQFKVNVDDTLNGATSLGIPTSIITVSLFLNGAAITFQQNISIQPLDDFYPCWIIAGPGDVISAQVTYDYSALPTKPTEVVFIAHMTGKILQANIMDKEKTALIAPQIPVRNS